MTRTADKADRGARVPRARIALASLVTAAGVVLAVGLGIWQMQRMAWKNELIATIEQRMSQAPVTPAQLSDALAAGKDLSYTRVRLGGSFDHEREIRFYTPGPEGPGWNLVTPFRSAQGQLFYVNRGYVAQARLGEAERPSGPVEITGVLRAYGARNAFTPDNDVNANVWHWYERAAMREHAGPGAQAGGGTELFAYVIEAEREPGHYPEGGATRLEIPNNHLQYVVTWFALALTLAGVYLVWLRQQLRRP